MPDAMPALVSQIQGPCDNLPSSWMDPLIPSQTLPSWSCIEVLARWSMRLTRVKALAQVTCRAVQDRRLPH